MTNISTNNMSKDLKIKFTITGFPPFYCLYPDPEDWTFDLKITPIV